MAKVKPEVTIVGGGLAGLSLGVALLQRGLAVRLFEATSYPRHRVCGEFIRGVSEQTLRYLGVWDVLPAFHWQQSLRWFRGDALVFEGDLPSSALGLSRYVLDEALARAFVELGGVLKTGQRVNYGGEGVIGASGRRRDRTSPWVGLKLHARGLDLSADLEMHSGSTGAGYVGLAEVENGWVNVSGLFEKSALRLSSGAPGKLPPLQKMVTSMRRLGLDDLASRVSQAEFREGSLTGVEGVQFGWVDPDSNYWSLGDAVSMIPPFTGNGMSIAFESAALAVEPLLHWSDGALSWEEALRIYQQRCERCFKPRVVLANGLHPLLTEKSFAPWLDPWLGSSLSPLPWLAEVIR